MHHAAQVEVRGKLSRDVSSSLPHLAEQGPSCFCGSSRLGGSCFWVSASSLFVTVRREQNTASFFSSRGRESVGFWRQIFLCPGPDFPNSIDQAGLKVTDIHLPLTLHPQVLSDRIKEKDHHHLGHYIFLFRWVPGVKLRSSGIQKYGFYLLQHLPALFSFLFLPVILRMVSYQGIGGVCHLVFGCYDGEIRSCLGHSGHHLRSSLFWLTFLKKYVYPTVSVLSS